MDLGTDGNGHWKRCWERRKVLAEASNGLFSELDKDEDMGVDKFISLLKKYCSTVKLSKDEHSKVTVVAKKNPTYLNYESYLACEIQIDGLSDLMLN